MTPAAPPPPSILHPPAYRMAVVIVHYKTPGLLKDCIASVLPEIDPARDCIVIVDNLSGEEHVAPLRDLRSPALTLIESDRNLGFAGANNVGIEQVRAAGDAAFFLLLNPDTIVRPGALAALRECLDRHPEIALVGPRLEYPDGTAQLSAFGDPTPISELVRGSNIGPIARLLKRWEVYGAIREEAHEAQWLSGACFLMRREVVDRIGLLDVRFFMYYEEVDFFRRARLAGLRAFYLPTARVVHLVGQASGVSHGAAAKRLPGYWFESRHHYFRKHFGYFGVVCADGFYVAGCALMRIRRLFTGVSRSSVAKSEMRDFVRHSFRQLRQPRIRRA